MNRGFRASAPDELWLTYITGLHLLCDPKVYPSPVINCFDGLPVPWSVGTRLTAELANSSLRGILRQAQERVLLLRGLGASAWRGLVEHPEAYLRYYCEGRIKESFGWMSPASTAGVQAMPPRRSRESSAPPFNKTSVHGPHHLHDKAPLLQHCYCPCTL